MAIFHSELKLPNAIFGQRGGPSNSERRPRQPQLGTLAVATTKLGLKKKIGVVRRCRQVQKKDLIHNDYTPDIQVDPQNYQVRADGQLLWCEPAEVLPMAQRYFLF